MHRIVLSFVVIAVLLPSGGCVRYPPDHSPYYQAVPLGAVDRRGRERYAMVPEACLVHDPAGVGLGEDRLPPGCANAYNLERMADRGGDLVRGRPLGPAAAAPAARAAQSYIDGTDGTDGATGGAAGGVGGGGVATTQEEAVGTRTKGSAKASSKGSSSARAAGSR
jgi:hypothetical protein